MFIHFLITFSSANGWAFVRNNAEICYVLNQLGNKALNATIGEELRYIQFSVGPTFCNIKFGIQNLFLVLLDAKICFKYYSDQFISNFWIFVIAIKRCWIFS